LPSILTANPNASQHNLLRLGSNRAAAGAGDA